MQQAVAGVDHYIPYVGYGIQRCTAIGEAGPRLVTAITFTLERPGSPLGFS